MALSGYLEEYSQAEGAIKVCGIYMASVIIPTDTRTTKGRGRLTHNFLSTRDVTTETRENRIQESGRSYHELECESRYITFPALPIQSHRLVVLKLQLVLSWVSRLESSTRTREMLRAS